jgi:hypothetical protein
MRHIALLVILVVALWPGDARAQTHRTAVDAVAEPTRPSLTDAVRMPSRESVLNAGTAPPLFRQNAVCDGCPIRRVGTAFLQVTMVNVAYGLTNLALGKDLAKVTPSTWWANMKRGWEWDPDSFSVNQIGHPYQGNNYFNAARANGLSFWESAGLTAFGSGTWEYFGETHRASLNDFVNTTLGGIAFGEMFHRAAWMVRDTQATGRARLWSELAATAIDPLTGYNRFRSGEASRVSAKPAEFVPTSRGSVTSAGVVWRGNSGEDISTTASPFIEVDLLYGNLEAGRASAPYDAFAVRLAFGGSSPVSEARVRGRLLSRPAREGRLQWTAVQSYQYNNNDAFQFGAQSFDVSAGTMRSVGARSSLWAIAWGGATILGAVDSAPPGSLSELPSPEDPADPQSTEEESREYDFGPGGNFGGVLNLRRDGRDLLRLLYEAHHLHVLDGIRANHFLQRLRMDLNVPLTGSFGLGITGEYFNRRTYYQANDVEDSSYSYPQFRLALTWSKS